MIRKLLIFGALLGFSHPSQAAETVRVDIATAVSAMLSSHPSISGKKADVQAKIHLADAARAARYPGISVQAGHMSSSNTRRNTSQSTLTLRARQPLWAFGRIDDSIAFADANVLVDRQDLLRVKRGLLKKTVLAYARTLDLNLRQKIFSSSIENLSQLHKQISRREVGQLASKADVRLAALRLGQARIQKTNINDQLLAALNELRTLTQISIIAVEPVDAELVNLPQSVDEVVNIAMKNSAEVKYNQALVSLAKADSERDKTSSFPTIYFQADRAFNSIGTNNNETRYGVVLDASLDGMGLAMFSNSQAASSREKAARDNLRAVQNDLSATVRSLMSSRKVRDSFLQLQQQAVADLQAIYKSYIRQYKAGKKSWLEVLNIERELMDQRLQLAQARNDWLQYTLRLAVLTGAFDNLVVQ